MEIPHVRRAFAYLPPFSACILSDGAGADDDGDVDGDGDGDVDGDLDGDGDGGDDDADADVDTAVVDDDAAGDDDDDDGPQKCETWLEANASCRINFSEPWADQTCKPHNLI